MRPSPIRHTIVLPSSLKENVCVFEAPSLSVWATTVVALSLSITRVAACGFAPGVEMVIVVPLAVISVCVAKVFPASCAPGATPSARVPRQCPSSYELGCLHPIDPAIARARTSFRTSVSLQNAPGE